MERSPTSSSCQHALLARSPVGHVSVCPECGVVHLSLDCLSLRLELTAFQALAQMLSQAKQRLDSRQTGGSHVRNAPGHALH